MMVLDTITYLPDDILVKVDRAAMHSSLETRVPFLDQRIFKYAWQLPLSSKISHQNGKQPLRALLSQYVPSSLFERPKMGFGIPIDQWLRGPLRDWASDLLDPQLISRDNFLDPDVISHLWDEHLSGTRNWQYLLWDVLMWQSWRNTNN
jgi:asparagine synthase (glutamine-hydrolysing)